MIEVIKLTAVSAAVAVAAYGLSITVLFGAAAVVQLVQQHLGVL